jgi:hypothetical protein
LVTVITALGVPAHATYGARVAVDEPQYLLTALSIGRDGNLDISDELAEEAYRPFHRVDLPRQTTPTGDTAREVSPHEPLLPLLLALPMRLGGWAAARATLAVLAGSLAALTAWTAMRRFAVSRAVAVGVTAAFACTAPLATYATQIYPELPAAFVVLLAVAALTAPLTRLSATVFTVAIVALPWLATKYVPVAVALVGVALWRWAAAPFPSRSRRRNIVVVVLSALAAAGGLYLLVHRWLYGGWTAYASSRLATEGGELSAIGSDPNYGGRARRLVGLLVDDGFGMALWMPAWLLLPFAAGFVWKRRGAAGTVLLVPLATGWLIATFVALTMHGWWWPGRQLVVVLPLAVITVAIAVEVSSALRVLFVIAAAVGFVTWVWITIEAISRRRVLVVDFDRTGNPWVQLLRPLLPDGRTPTAADSALLFVWSVAVVGIGWAGWRYAEMGARAESGRPAHHSSNWAAYPGRSDAGATQNR